MTDTFNQNWIGAFNEGDPKAVARWFKTKYQEIFSEVSLRTNDSPDTLDLVMDVVTIILERKGEFETVRKIERYLYKVIGTICGQYKKKGKNRITYSPGLPEHIKDLEEEAIRKAIIRNKYSALEYLAMENLPYQCLQIFRLFYHDEMRNKEIAELLNISESAVEQHKSTAFKKLRTAFHNHTNSNRAKFMFIISLPLFICYYLIHKILS